MTTIAYDGKTLVSDSQSTIGNMKYEVDCPKLHRDVGPFAVLGVAGDFQTAQDIIEVIGEYAKISQIRTLQFSGEDPPTVHMLGITHDGSVWFYDGKQGFELRADLPYAIGSGSEYALGAMAAGASAEQAVLIASQYDLYTNSNLQIATIKFESDQDGPTLH